MIDKVYTLTLTLTQNCNLNCSYCYESNKKTAIMHYKDAVSIILRELDGCPNDMQMEVDLFGGEPFLEFETIKRIVKTIRQKTDKITFFVVTNGTLVHGAIKEWLIANKDVVICGLSYDGNTYMQNINRSNSANMIDLAFFRELYPDQPIKMTISKQSLPFLSDGVRYLYEFGFKEVACNLAYGIDWDNRENEIILENELKKLIDFFLDNPQYKPCSMLEMGIETCVPKDKMFRFCGAGVNMIAYDVDGESYPCQMFMPITAGTEKAKESKNITFYDEEIPLYLLPEKCRNCIVRLSCPTCYGANYLAYGNIYVHAEDYCKLTKRIMKARSYFKGKQWERKQIQLSIEEEHKLINDILTIQTTF